MTARDTQTLIADHVALSTSQLVGRQGELALLWKQYEAARNGYAKVVLLVGELGIGKTRLLDEFAARAAQDGAAVLRGGASEAEGMPPYLPFLEALGQHIRITPLDQLREQVAVAPQILVSILPELAIKLGEYSVHYSLPPEQARLRLYQAIGTFLEVISAPHALVLTLDDLHWVDSASLDLLCYIARHHSKAKLLVVGTYREGEIDRNTAFERAVTELTHQRVLMSVGVEPLSATEVEALAVSYLGGPICSSVSQLLHVQSEGNPFFAEELLHGWVEEGALIQENNRWIAVAPLEHALPSSIVGALRQRFARLSANIIDHLRIAAIIGRTFDLSLLATVEDQEGETVEEALLEAERARLVRTDRAGLFTFSHDKIRECLYAEVSTSRRRRLHEAIGRVLEAQYNQGSVKNTYKLAELAFHFARSNDRARGATYSQLAAEQALQSSAIKEAIAHYQMALGLLDPRDRRRGELLLGLGEAALLADLENETAVAAYEAALTCLLQSEGKKAAARAAHGLGLAQWRQGSLQAARIALEQTLGLLGNDLSVKRGKVLVDLATLLTIYMDQQAEGVSYAQQALEMARCLEDSSLEAAASRAVAGDLYVPGSDISSALKSFERALALAIRSNDLPEAATCCFYLAAAYYCTGEIRRSHEVCQLGMEFIERCQQPYHLRGAYSWFALLHASQGAWAKAGQAIEQAQPFVDNLSSTLATDFLRQIRGFLAYQREEYLTAESEFQAAMQNQQRSPLSLMLFTGLLGLAQAALGEHEKAYAHITELETLLAELPPGTLPTAPIMTCLALIAIAIGDQERAALLYPRLLAFRGQHYWFLVDRVLGEVAALRRDWEMAIMHFSTAEATAKREGLYPELARTLVGRANLELARGSQGGNTHAINYLKQALVLYEELKMANAVERVRRQLQTLSHRLNGSAPPPLPADLTKSEARVLQLVVQGKSNRQIAADLGISQKTVANHLSHIFLKTESENRAAAAAFAIRHGLA